MLPANKSGFSDSECKAQKKPRQTNWKGTEILVLKGEERKIQLDYFSESKEVEIV